MVFINLNEAPSSSSALLFVPILSYPFVSNVPIREAVSWRFYSNDIASKVEGSLGGDCVPYLRMIR